MKRTRNLIYALTFLLAATGFLLGFWPLAAAGVVCAALLGRPFFAIVVGLLLDLAYGQPIGILYYVFFPFTLLALLSIAAHFFGKRYLLQKNGPGYM